MAAVVDSFVTREGGRLIHGPFSNGFIEPDGSHVEGEYQAYSKTTDPVLRARVMFRNVPDNVTPEDAQELVAGRGEWRPPFGREGSKRAGRSVSLRSDHGLVKIPIMAFFVARKFIEWPGLGERLRLTGQAYLIEGNTWHDNFFGDCRCGNKDGLHAECERPGMNHLGVILMGVRETLRIRGGKRDG